MPIKSTIGLVSPIGRRNHVLNPSGEGAANFSNQAGGTVSRVTTFQAYGLYSYQVVTTGAGDGGNFTMLALGNNPNYITFRVKMSNVRLNITIGSATREAVLLEKIDNDWRLFGALFTASETSTQTNLRITQIGAGANTLYLDGLQAEPAENAHYSTYIDGTQEGCSFLGAPHASASVRSADSRAGGEVLDFWKGFGFFPEKILGGGAAVEELNIDNYAFLPGGELNSAKIQPREFSVIGYFLGNTVEELHEKAQGLELALGLDTYPARQALRLRYTGARVQKEIASRYAGGLEGDLPIYHNDSWSVEDEKWQRNYKFKMRASVQFIATDPFWYETLESAQLLDTLDSATFRVVAARLEETGQWSNLGPPGAGGTYTIVYSIVEDSVYLYVSGNFLNFDGIANGDRIAQYNKQTGVWSALGSGMNGDVFALVLGPDGRLYAGGSFSTAGGTAVNNIAVWDGSAWAALGSGLNSDVHSLVFGPDGTLYVGGGFTTAGGGAANYIASWDGSTWAALGSGMGGSIDNSVYSLAFGGGLLYASGGFVTSGGTATNYIASWDGSTWAALGSGGDLAATGHHALAYDERAGLLYAGVRLAATSDYLNVWNGATWTDIGAGLSGVIQSVAIGPDGILYVGGNFTTIGGLSLADRVARYNGYAWSMLDIDLPGTPAVYTILTGKAGPVISQEYNLYLGFSTTGTGTFAGSVDTPNSGTIPAFPRIIFNRSGGTGATVQTLRNERTGRELLFNYSLLNGESLIVDLDPKARTITSSFFGPRMDAVLANSDFSSWQLLPRDNQITAFVSESGSPTVTAFLIWKDAYRSYN